ncbi:MAG: hypothetical protein K2W95_25525 [Candidatus Obscuribacterales bacterium]|nr:hypothetical protein [Candidatus Obscuribacterales bacterium]
MAKKRQKLDNCQVCKGAHGGVPGNENVMNGIVICDYCTVACLGEGALQTAARAAVEARDTARLLELVQQYQQQARAAREQRLRKQ